MTRTPFTPPAPVTEDARIARLTAILNGSVGKGKESVNRSLVRDGLISAHVHGACGAYGMGTRYTITDAGRKYLCP